MAVPGPPRQQKGSTQTGHELLQAGSIFVLSLPTTRRACNLVLEAARAKHRHRRLTLPWRPWPGPLPLSLPPPGHGSAWAAARSPQVTAPPHLPNASSSGGPCRTETTPALPHPHCPITPTPSRGEARPVPLPASERVPARAGLAPVVVAAETLALPQQGPVQPQHLGSAGRCHVAGTRRVLPQRGPFPRPQRPGPRRPPEPPPRRAGRQAGAEAAAAAVVAGAHGLAVSGGSVRRRLGPGPGRGRGLRALRQLRRPRGRRELFRAEGSGRVGRGRRHRCGGSAAVLLLKPRPVLKRCRRFPTRAPAGLGRCGSERPKRWLSGGSREGPSGGERKTSVRIN